MRKHKGFEFVDVALSIITVCVIAIGLGAVFAVFQEVRNPPEIVSIYDNNGNVIQKWSGVSRFYNSDKGVRFEVDGQRIIVRGGIVIAK